MIHHDILQWPHPILRQKAEPITRFDQSVHNLSFELKRVLSRTRNACGLAAPQIGVSKRMFVTYVNGKYETWVNPVIEFTAPHGSLDHEEGCLSIPNVFVKVPCAKRIAISARTEFGVERRHFWDISQGDTIAIVFQHELHHLDGEIMLDRLSDDGLKAVEARHPWLAEARTRDA